MEGRLELTGLAGHLDWGREGEHILVRARARGGGDGLYKLYLFGRGGELEAGALLPRGSGLELERRVALVRLEGSGCWPLLGGEARRVFAFPLAEDWRPGAGLEGKLHDPVLRRAARGLSDVLVRETARGWEAAIPFRPGRELELVPLVCLGRLMEHGGALYLRFAFDRAGRPLVPR